jgi:hypothetical protein
MSDIYNSYYEDKEPKRYDKTKPMDMLRVQAGLILETIIEEGFQASFGLLMGGERPGEFFTDPIGKATEGIAYTPDLLLFPPKRTVLGEIKVTWMSAQGVPISPAQEKATGIPSNWDGIGFAEFSEKFAKYFTQMKAYCYWLDTPHARLIVYFVNGNWRPPIPCLLAWDFEFTTVELVENWHKLTNHARSKGML